MTKKEVNVFDYGTEILKSVKKGVLLTAKANGRVNTMTISWGTLGIEWGYPIFTTFVREGRFTRSLLDANGEFTISVPLNKKMGKILGTCGSKSGRDINKEETLGLTLVDSDTISVPGIGEAALILECKVAYKQLQDLNAMSDIEARKNCYPQDVPGDYPMANKDAHIAFYGHVMKAYLLEEE